MQEILEKLDPFCECVRNWLYSSELANKRLTITTWVCCLCITRFLIYLFVVCRRLEMAVSLSDSPPSQGPICPVCFRDYSDSEAELIPRILQCGHTYCTREPNVTASLFRRCHSGRLYSHSCDRRSKLWVALFGGLTVDHTDFRGLEHCPCCISAIDFWLHTHLQKYMEERV